MKPLYPLCLCALLVLTGCPQIFRDEDPLRYYTLGALVQDLETAPEAVLDGLAVGIRQPRLADYLDDPGVVVRRGAHIIEPSRHHRWGGRLDREIGRAVAAGLAARTDLARVDLVPFPPQAAHDFIVQLHVRRFEGHIGERGRRGPGGEVRALIEWEIIQAPEVISVATGTLDYRDADWAGDDNFAALVEGLDAALVALVDELVAALSAVAE